MSYRNASTLAIVILCTSIQISMCRQIETNYPPNHSVFPIFGDFVSNAPNTKERHIVQIDFGANFLIIITNVKWLIITYKCNIHVTTDHSDCSSFLGGLTPQERAEPMSFRQICKFKAMCHYLKTCKLDNHSLPTSGKFPSNFTDRIEVPRMMKGGCCSSKKTERRQWQWGGNKCFSKRYDF